MTVIESLLEDARKRLVETGTRNRLIHVNRNASRGNFLNIINERSDDIFGILRVNSKKMKFAGKGEETDQYDDDLLLEELPDEEFDEGRYTDSILETPLTPDALQKRLLRLAKDARTAEEEQGINILFLAMGFLRWYEDQRSDVPRESPLILIPVALVRNNKTSTYDLEVRDDDIVTNLSLQERLKLDFGITLPEIDDSSDWTPSDYFSRVNEAIEGRERWSLDEDGMQLGFFSFAKLMMLRDLDPANWDESALLENHLVTGLLADGFESESPLFGKEDNLDEVLEPNTILHVVDADSSQTKVIEEVRSGRNLVVQGPPGTGKSQTITNILAAAAFDNKKVLFVAEKMAALEVVHRRMVKVGLKDLCLELHSRSANKKVFLQGLAETISRSIGVEAPELDAEELTQVRDKLNSLTNLLHESVPNRDYSPFEVISELCSFIGQDRTAPKFDASAIESFSRLDVASLRETLSDYLAIVNKYGFGDDNPFFGAQNLNLQPTELVRLVDDLEKAKVVLEAWNKFQRGIEEPISEAVELTLKNSDRARRVYKALKAAPPGASAYIEMIHGAQGDTRFIEAVNAGADWVEHKAKLETVLVDSVWDQSFAQYRQPLADGVASFWSRLFGGYRAASKVLRGVLKGELPKSPQDRLDLLDDILDGAKKQALFKEDSEYLSSLLGNAWRGERTPFSKIQGTQTWLTAANEELATYTSEKLNHLVVSNTADEFNESDFEEKRQLLIKAFERVAEKLQMSQLSGSEFEQLSLTTLLETLERMIDQKERYSEWTSIRFARGKMEALNCEAFIEMLESNQLAAADADVELRYALCEARWNYARSQLGELESLASLDRHYLVNAFQDLEKVRVSDVQDAIRDAHLSQVPKGSAGAMGLIRGEIAKKRNHRPIRQLMTGAGEMIQRIKPVFLMSPISVAQFLPPGELEFDLLVIDEASQVKPEDALGSVARAKQIVVVGDQKQLPPTSFFDRLTDNEQHEEDEDLGVGVKATEMESVLSLCEARGLNQSMLEWHYRSRDPSLIAVSNAEFYRNQLILPPCPTESDGSFGLKLVGVPGVYSTSTRGGGRPTTNRIEAESIANRLIELAEQRADFSVGVVTFSKTQADMVTEVLEMRRRENSVLDAFLREDKAENVFVKNIENVQGDERDIILISIGYGPYEPNGKLPSMSFGPINSEGGERRLNVLFSRSRVACEVYCSFDPSDIDLSRTSKVGPSILKKFLEFAKTGELLETFASEGDADSPFEEDVANVIRGMGYEVDHQVGTAGFKIDLGVRNPVRYEHHMLAVECDGATYHSALWARERDRLRQGVLEGFGWKFHRIWSTDWFYRRDSEIQKLRTALEDARVREVTSSIEGANAEGQKPVESFEQEPEAPIILEDSFIELPKYKRAKVIAHGHYEPHERPLNEVLGLLSEIIAVEGLICTDEVARRYAIAHGKTRVGSRILEHVQKGLTKAKRDGLVKQDGNFWGTEEQFAKVPVRDRSDESIPTTSAESISPVEICACADLIEKESGLLETEEMVRVIAKTLGFKRAGPDFQSKVIKALKSKKDAP